ncbi:hypothetical protein V5799_016832 [Amblyomma americanum]|uniref:Apple domain-containing protein n=1 Tax=Amblyomma americanum TaxID=6943 RepID=A0AAQ4F555_AMBAM
MTEYYDTKQIQGYLRLYNEGIVIETYYNHDTNEAFFYTDPAISSSGSAYNPPTPLRIVQGKEVSDITMMTEYEGDPEEKFLIPVGRTCTRLAQGLRKPPDFANVSLEFHAEIMFRNVQESPDFYYSSHLNFIRDLSSNHLSAIFEPWATSDRNAKKMVFGGTYQEIYDYENGIYFKINKTGHRESCTMNTLDGYKLEMELPGFGKLGMVPVIFVEEKDLMQASYLGIHYERGMPTHAFEIITDGLGGGTSKIKKAALTYYYLGPYFDITLNIHDLTTVMERMNEKMSVLSCYDENEQSFTWFQVGFPVGSELRGFTTSQFGVHLKAAAPSSLHVGTFPLEDCSDICRDRDDCLAFSSCLASNECILSFDRTPPSDAVEKQTMCSVFSKTFTVSFNELEGMSLAMKAKKFAAVPDKEDCARLCLGEKDFDCKSFDYCSLTRDPATVCRLHDTHLREYGDPAKLDAKNAEKCFHYSKKYLYDFSKTKSQRIFGRQAFTVINQVSVEECARQCWEATFECKNFDFCSPPGTRKLGYGDCTLYARSDGPIKTTMSPICSTYTYTGNPDMVQAPSVEQSAALHSNAKAGGLAFFMVLLGIGIGAAALFGYGFYKAHRANRV